MKYTVLQRVSQNIEEVILRKTDLGIALWELLIQEHPADIAQFIISIPQHQATELFLPFDKNLKLEIFGYLPEFARAELITGLPIQDKQFILTQTHADDISDMFAYLSDAELKQCLNLLNKQDQKRVLDLSKFPPETACGIMTIDVLKLIKDFTVAKSIELLQRLQPNKDLHQTIYVTDSDAHLVGYIQLQDLVLKSPETRLESILEEVPYVALSHEDQKVVAKNMVHYQMMSVPVVDEREQLLGVITSDTLVHVVQKEAGEDVQRMAGAPVTESYFEASFWKLLYKRGAILAVLMIAESLTSVIVHNYEHMLSSFLIGFFTMLVSTGGNTSSQTSAIVIQGVNSGVINDTTLGRFFKRELWMGFALGIILGVITFIRVYAFKHLLLETIVVSVSVALIVMLSVLLGSGVPVLLRRIGVDPAFSAGPFLATLMDILGILIYCYIASLILS